ncbi:MAG: tripartite tricarboxylate transporter substrate binding protein [Chloroflexota bacterium]|jgi:tripartite-type tricarboxylate transporter receptor subunit TctC
MKRYSVLLSVVVIGLSFLVIACSDGGSASSPTAAPTKPATTAEAPKDGSAVPTAAPTAAAAEKLDFPAKGKAITILVGYSAGGTTDVAARHLASFMEKDLGVPVEVVNKPGATSQIAYTELAKAKPDGYTLGVVILPAMVGTYVDPRREAPYTRESFQTIALHHLDTPGLIVVKSSSPYKTIKDLIDAAKANPGTITATTSGIGSTPHLAVLTVEQVTGAKFKIVHFDGIAEASAAFLGGHVDVDFTAGPSMLSYMESGEVRILGVQDKQESKYWPGVKTFESMGYPFYSTPYKGLCAPAGTPKEIVDRLSLSVKNATEDEEHRKNMDASKLAVHYMNPEEFASYWQEREAELIPVYERIIKESEDK